MKLRKKLIEVALPLEAINKASAREKSIRHGHPSTLHLWWARRPLAAARAVIFSQMVDDPSEYVDTLKSDPKLRRRAESELRKRHKVWEEAIAVKEKADAAGVESPEPGPEPTLDEIIAEQERDRLFKIIEELVLWENTTNETVLEKARAELWQSWRRACADNADDPRAAELFDRNKLPAFHDPFAGGGAIPLEAQRLGLDAYASDLNPVAVLINKAMIEIPPKFAGMPPVNPEWQSKPEAEKAMRVWKGAAGLAEDVRYYGKWMRNEAEKRIGHLYPKVEVTEEMARERPDLKQYVGKKLSVTAWIWARTVKSPNPAFRDVDVPLASTFMLSTKKGKEAFIEPIVAHGGLSFEVRMGKPADLEAAKKGTKLGRGASFKCVMSDTAISSEYVKSEGIAGRMGDQLLGIVAQHNKSRVFLPPSKDQELSARSVESAWKPEVSLPNDPRNFWTVPYGVTTYGDLFTPRQLVALNTFSDLVTEALGRVEANIQVANNGSTFNNNEYARSVATYLAFGISRASDYWNSNATLEPEGGFIAHLFGRNAIPMVWDFAESNPFSNSSGNWDATCLEWIERVLKNFWPSNKGSATQADAQSQLISSAKIVSTDPPYYDNIGYADLSDFFYVWLRRTQRNVYPDLFSTLTVPKSEELVANPYRHGSQRGAETFFLDGMTQAMSRVAGSSHEAFPVTIYYAFKQSESKDDVGETSTGWETFLTAVIQSGFSLTGTWPIRTERAVGLKGSSNSLASSIVLVCRKRGRILQTVARREFVSALKSELPTALRHLQRGNIAPVDLAQAAIGPGMSIYTRYEKVLDAEGKPLSVRNALALINETLDEVLAEQEGDFDPDTRWALTWFEQFGFDEAEYGVAEQLSKAKNTSVAEMADPRTSPILQSKGGKVRLFRPEELESDWAPDTDGRLTVWDMVHQLIRALESKGETAAAAIVAKLGARAETARELCYRLYTVCERKKRAPEALSYNGLVQSWPEIVRLSQQQDPTSTQGEMFT